MKKYVKINITLPEDLLNEINGYVEDHGMTRSGFLAAVVRDRFKAEAMAPAVKDMMGSLSALCSQVAAGSIPLDEARAAVDQIDRDFQETKAQVALFD